eukprot:TRINITY_DN3360_c0_g1_i1.p1 TRINITY_DN3360_c0_g1~~TRINITY_DN3360_c0_g1_i1.p1  ORF type:complete len:108 (+),score=18.47 TRINITY_DN3360_c0_g1_i1:111-434(+)
MKQFFLKKYQFQSLNAELSDQDFILTLFLKNSHTPVALTEFADIEGRFRGTHALLLSFVPEVPGEAYEVNSDIYFLVDQSGSMRGSPIEHASSTLGRSSETAKAHRG